MSVKGLLAGLGLVTVSGVIAGNAITINAQEYGDAWPFTLPEVQLQCHPGMVLVVKDLQSGTGYPINGEASAKAQQLKLADLADIWRADPQVEEAKISLSPVVQRGIRLCVD